MSPVGLLAKALAPRGAPRPAPCRRGRTSFLPLNKYSEATGGLLTPSGAPQCFFGILAPPHAPPPLKFFVCLSADWTGKEQAWMDSGTLRSDLVHCIYSQVLRCPATRCTPRKTDNSKSRSFSGHGHGSARSPTAARRSGSCVFCSPSKMSCSESGWPPAVGSGGTSHRHLKFQGCNSLEVSIPCTSNWTQRKTVLTQQPPLKARKTQHLAVPALISFLQLQNCGRSKYLFEFYYVNKAFYQGRGLGRKQPSMRSWPCQGFQALGPKGQRLQKERSMSFNS